jgi:Arc/MetJ-type ribon-helix-helix transcriptional regulator
MSELKIVLRGETADKLRKLVADGAYAQPEDAVADALEALETSDDPELDSWLRDVVVPRAKALEADPSRGLTPEEVLARLRDKP